MIKNLPNYLVFREKLMEIHALAARGEVKSSYIHGCSTISLLFDTIGQRLQLAVKKVKKNAKKF